jgi:hypothetical protein
LQVDQARRLKEPEQENTRLKRVVANLSLDNLVLKDLASGNFVSFRQGCMISAVRVGRVR